MRITRGFLRPVQRHELTPGQDALISAICPGLNVEREAEGGGSHPVWGPWLNVWTGHATAPRLRHHASSGGVLSAVLIHLLETRQVDYVVQNAASTDSPLRNAVQESLNADHVYYAAGSRYAPSAPLQRLHECLERPGRFAFVGKPCDVAALRAWQRRDRSVAWKAPYLISFFCAGIPNEDGTLEILRRLGVNEAHVAEFRYRGDGWPGHATARERSGRVRRMTYNDSWGHVLSKRVQFRCKLCPDGSGGSADFVCADAWYGDESGYPDFTEAAGRSLVLSRTRKGDQIIQQAQAMGRIELTPCSIDEIERMQPSQARRNRLVLSRLAAMVLLGRRVPRYRGFNLLRCARGKPAAQLRSFLGMARRIVLNRL